MKQNMSESTEADKLKLENVQLGFARVVTGAKKRHGRLFLVDEIKLKWNLCMVLFMVKLMTIYVT